MRPEPLITPGAKGDIFVALTYYNEQRVDLGYEFLDELERAILLIRETPLLYPLVDDPVRRALVRRFPYGIFYVGGEPSDVVLAVLDLRQDPLVIARTYGERR